MVLPRSGAQRVMAVCRSEAVACPKCGRKFGHEQIPADGRTFRVCPHKSNGRHCGGRAFIIGMGVDFCTVILISEEEWRELASERAEHILRDLGVLVEAITHVHQERR